MSSQMKTSQSMSKGTKYMPIPRLPDISLSYAVRVAILSQWNFAWGFTFCHVSTTIKEKLHRH